jgi:hypothetical protein
LEASLLASSRKPHNVAHKRVAKKLKVTETTSQEVNSSSRVVEYLSCNLVYANNRIRVLAGDSAGWETVGEPAERCRGPAPTVEELVSQLTKRSATEVEPQAPVAERRTEPAATAAAEEPTTAQAEGMAPAEAGLVDIASILGARP